MVCLDDFDSVVATYIVDFSDYSILSNEQQLSHNRRFHGILAKMCKNSRAGRNGSDKATKMRFSRRPTPSLLPSSKGSVGTESSMMGFLRTTAAKLRVEQRCRVVRRAMVQACPVLSSYSNHQMDFSERDKEFPHLQRAN